MATVYLARDRELRRDVAVKVLFPHLCKKREVVARFHREARAAAGLDHPHILRVLDVGGGSREREGESGGEELDPPFIVLELVRGPSLKDFVSEHRPPLAEVVACVGAALASALAEAHQAGVIHRDVKPANVMIAEGGRLVLADFGVARVDEEDSVVTRTGALLGTPSFMSPEQATGAALDARSDLYSLGATLYQLATGFLPFSGNTARVVAAIVTGDFVPPLRRNPAIGPDLARVIEKLMALEPGERYDDAASASEALRRVAEAGGVDDPEALLESFFSDPRAAGEELAERVQAATLERARRAAEERALPRAMALADRVLALDKDNAGALELVESLSSGRRLRRGAIAGGALVACAALAAWVVWPGSGEEKGAIAAGGGVEDAGEGALAVRDAGGVDPGAVDRTPDAGRRTPDAGRRTGDTGRRTGETGRRTPDTKRRTGETGRRAGDRGERRASGTEDRGGSGEERGAEALSGQGQGQGRGQGGDGTGAVDAGTGGGEERAEAERAWVTLDMNRWCNISIDGRGYGRTPPERRIELDPGRHRIVCSQGPNLLSWEETVTLEPGEHRRLEGDLVRWVRVEVDLARADAVKIGSRQVRDGASLKVRQGRRRLVLLRGGKVLRVVHVVLPRVSACTLRDRPAVGCYR